MEISVTNPLLANFYVHMNFKTGAAFSLWKKMKISSRQWVFVWCLYCDRNHNNISCEFIFCIVT